MSVKVNIVNLEQARDSARIYKWDTEITFAGLSGASNAINLRCTTHDVPNPTHNVIDVNIRGFTKKETGAVDWNPLTLTVIELDDWSLLRALYDLCNNYQFDYATGKQQRKATYSNGNAGMLITLQGVDDTIPESWKIYGCVIETYTPPQMSNDKAGTVEMSFTTHYDYAQLISGTSGP